MAVLNKWQRMVCFLRDKPKPAAFRLTRDDVERHSRAVMRVRLILPILGVGIIAGYFLSVRVPEVDAAFAQEFSQIGLAATDLHMTAPTYLGEDEEGIPYKLAAQAARQHLDDPDLISLKNPMGFSEEDGTGNVQLIAPAGQFQKSTNTLSLSDGVEVERKIADGNYLITTSEAKFDIAEQTLFSDSGIQGEGDRGSLIADQIRTLKDGTIVLEGNVKMRITPKSKTKAEQSGKVKQSQKAGQNGQVIYNCEARSGAIHPDETRDGACEGAQKDHPSKLRQGRAAGLDLTRG